MERYGALICQIIVIKIAGEASRSELDEWADLLKKMVFSQQPYIKVWLSNALDNTSFPSQNIGSLEKHLFLQKIMRLDHHRPRTFLY